MSPDTSTHRWTAITAVTAGVITASVLTAAPAQADCKLPSNAMFCNPSSTRPGSPGGGGGSGTGGGPSGPVAPPTLIDLTADEAVESIPGTGGPVTPAAPSTLQLVEQAMTTKAFPTPTAHTAPDGKTYVRMRTTLWVEGFETLQTEPVSAGDQTVQATAAPVSVRWNLGEKSILCQDAGSRTGETCNYTYKRSSAGQTGGRYQITATITWRVTWTCEGGECDSAGGDLGEQTSTSQPTPLVVSEIQTNTGQ